MIPPAPVSAFPTAGPRGLRKPVAPMVNKLDKLAKLASALKTRRNWTRSLARTYAATPPNWRAKLAAGGLLLRVGSPGIGATPAQPQDGAPGS
jgi:hypothetical protein